MLESVWHTLSDVHLPPLDADTRRPVSAQSMLDAYLPALLSVYITAWLALRSSPLFLKVAWLPIPLFALYRCSMTLDLTRVEGGSANDRLSYLNQGLLLQNTFYTLCSLAWTFGPTPTKRDGSKSSPLELMFSFRGLDYTFSSYSRTHVAPEWRPTSSRSLFALYTLASLLFHLTLSDIIHMYIQIIAPHTLQGGSIFAPEQTPTLFSTYLTLLAGVVVYSVIQLVYDAATFVGVVIFRQEPTAWPPVFQQPWLATSLSQFWGRRWHQLFKYYFVTIGATPARFLPPLIANIAAVMGVFFVSGCLHFIGGWGMGKGADWWPLAGFFLVNGVGLLLENAWRRVTGSKVGGYFGWIWTMLFVAFWGNWLVDGWSKIGLIASVFFPEGRRPAEMLGMSLG
ncbi:membrane bound O-acyl transferase family-domain-containing protein [Mucidula mucida]|nr:membrane bound O-acyl transferase family-domain-containing protein [Mucidula mucida]